MTPAFAGGCRDYNDTSMGPFGTGIGEDTSDADTDTDPFGLSRGRIVAAEHRKRSLLDLPEHIECIAMAAGGVVHQPSTSSIALSMSVSSTGFDRYRAAPWRSPQILSVS